MTVDFRDREAGQGHAEAMGEFTGEGLHLDGEAGGKGGTPTPWLLLETGQAGQGEPLTPLADHLPRRVEARRDGTIGQTLGRPGGRFWRESRHDTVTYI